ncbi:MAG: sigma-70 family RNA polymerase sigma factor [Planctomycetota bacterium]
MLSDRYLPLVWRYAYALLGSTHAAEDVVGDTMLALLRNINQIDADAPRISAWLRSVVRHKVADHHRRVYRAKDHLPRIAVEKQQRGESADPSESLFVDEKRQLITEILEGLPERQRLALEWKYIDGMRVREIATRLGETEKAVEATLYRARREFRRLYELSETGSATVVASTAGNCASGAINWQTTSTEAPKK